MCASLDLKSDPWADELFFFYREARSLPARFSWFFFEYLSLVPLFSILLSLESSCCSSPLIPALPLSIASCGFLARPPLQDLRLFFQERSSLGGSPAFYPLPASSFSRVFPTWMVFRTDLIGSPSGSRDFSFCFGRFFRPV